MANHITDETGSFAKSGLISELVGRLIKITDVHVTSTGSMPIKDIVIREGEPVHVAIPTGLMKISVVEFTIWTREDIEALAESFNENWAEAVANNTMDIGIEMGSVNYRANIFSYKGSLGRNGKLGMSIRVFPRELLTLEELDVPTKVISWFDQRIGLILFVGGTGVGKSTTVAAGIDRINDKRTGHVVVVEDPIEFQHTSRGCLITQREIGTNARNVAEAVHGAMRQNPIVVSTGEIRTREDADAALYVGDSGRLAMATTHGSSAVGGISRMINLFPDDVRSSKTQALAGCLIGVLYQVLMPLADGKGWVPGYEYVSVTTHVKKLIETQSWAELTLLLQDGKTLEDSQSLNSELLRLVKSGHVAPDDAKACAYRKVELISKLADDLRSKKNAPQSQQAMAA